MIFDNVPKFIAAWSIGSFILTDVGLSPVLVIHVILEIRPRHLLLNSIFSILSSQFHSLRLTSLDSTISPRGRASTLVHRTTALKPAQDAHAAPGLLAQPVWPVCKPCQDEGALKKSTPCRISSSSQSFSTKKGKGNPNPSCQLSMHVRKQVCDLSACCAPGLLIPSFRVSLLFIVRNPAFGCITLHVSYGRLPHYGHDRADGASIRASPATRYVAFHSPSPCCRFNLAGSKCAASTCNAPREGGCPGDVSYDPSESATLESFAG